MRDRLIAKAVAGNRDFCSINMVLSGSCGSCATNRALFSFFLQTKCSLSISVSPPFGLSSFSFLVLSPSLPCPSFSLFPFPHSTCLLCPFVPLSYPLPYPCCRHLLSSFLLSSLTSFLLSPSPHPHLHSPSLTPHSTLPFTPLPLTLAHTHTGIAKHPDHALPGQTEDEAIVSPQPKLIKPHLVLLPSRLPRPLIHLNPHLSFTTPTRTRTRRHV